MRKKRLKEAYIHTIPVDDNLTVQNLVDAIVVYRKVLSEAHHALTHPRDLWAPNLLQRIEDALGGEK
jgi:hypothetical protein